MAMFYNAIVLGALLGAQSPALASELSASAMFAPAEDARPMTLTLPHALQKGETAWLLVKLGNIGRTQVELTTHDGRTLGTISPYAVRSGQAAGTYTVPVPPGAIDKRQLALRLSLLEPGGAHRAPTIKEVISVRLVIRRFQSSG